MMTARRQATKQSKKRTTQAVIIPGAKLKELRQLADLSGTEMAGLLGSGYSPAWVRSKENSIAGISDQDWLHILTTLEALYQRKLGIAQSIDRLETQFKSLQ